MKNLTYLSKSGFLTEAPFGKNRVHRLRYLHEPTCFVHPCYYLTNRDAQGIMFHPSRQQLGFQRPKNKKYKNDNGFQIQSFVDSFEEKFVDNFKDNSETIS